MHKSQLLYEPLPIVRIGIELETEKVIMANDYSCFTHMLEEYISYGVINIYMPKSAPESSYVDKMPPILKRRIKIFNDDNETEAMCRLLHGLRKEFNILLSDETGKPIFKKGFPKETFKLISQTQDIIRKIAIGFNHGIQIGLNPELAKSTLKTLRSMVRDSQTRTILAQMESVMNLYGGVTFQAPALPKDTPSDEIISIFDRLLNDQSYLEYSASVASLSEPALRPKALLYIRELERKIRALPYASTGWNYTTKIIQAMTGYSLPESNAISSIIRGRHLPALVDLKEIRESAVDLWKKNNLVETPVGPDGSLIKKGTVYWIPPLPSMQIPSTQGSISISIGSASELKHALENATSHLDSMKKK
ncbi:hypothetical protein [Cedecea neteri]|uniref:hypothetical protein n=1 Tax=Cedecea neteri TaxID=158822 RepID=UPI0028A0D84C|nr:hypothetical protein [Cedecea neteri]